MAPVIAMILRTRDQVDLVDAVVAFHLSAGVDFVLAVDHGSVDGTAAVLESYESRGRLRLFREEGEEIRLRRTDLARLAAEEHGADWILHPDGDEFWWPRGGSWKEILEPLPERFGIVRGAWRHFAPRPDDDEDRYFAERLTVRVSPYAPRTGLEGPFHPGVKNAHRARPGVVVHKGHEVSGAGLAVVRGWFPFEILHFPLRSREQARLKYERLAAGLEAGGLHVAPHVARARAEIESGRWESAYAELEVDDAALARGLADGTLVEDTRLRDALRLLAGCDCDSLPAAPRFRLAQGGARAPALSFETTLAEDASYAHDLQVLQERESDVRAEKRIDLLEGRLRALSHGRRSVARALPGRRAP